MNVSNVQPAPIEAGSAPLVDAKRASLQMALLKKSLDMQQQQVQLSREFEGKGTIIDMRV